MNKKNNFLYYYIYLTKNLITKKCYVGWHATNKLYDGYIGSGHYFLKSIRKYGKDNFINGIIEFCSENVVLEREKYWIEKMNTIQPNGYNLTTGGEGCIGYKHTPESKRKMGLRKISNEHKQKIGERQIGNKNRLGKNFTQEQKNKISKSLSDKFNDKKESIKKLYLEGKSISEIVKILKCSTKTISKIIKENNIEKRPWTFYGDGKIKSETKIKLSISHLKNSEQKRNSIKELYLNGETTTNIRKILNTSPNTITRVLKELNK